MPTEEKSEQDVLLELEAKSTVPTDTKSGPVLKDSVSEQAKDFNQRRALRWTMAIFIMLLLIGEVAFLFFVVSWQGFGHLNKKFVLNEWAFGFLTNGVLIQTFFSLRTIITHLFPEGGREFKG